MTIRYSVTIRADGFNPEHDDRGRFASGPGDSGSGGGMSEEAAQAHFDSRIRALSAAGKLTFHHESPGDQLESIRASGIRGEYGVFATINRPSGFVTSKVKTKVEFQVPKAFVGTRMLDIGPDMRYGGGEHLGPHQDLLRSHGGDVIGADVSINRNIPAAWITRITVTGPNPKHWSKGA